LKDLDPRLKIDKYRLDDELLANPQLVQDANEELAEAIAIRDTLKEELDTINARLDAEIREELEKDKKKATENIVAMKVQLHPDHKKAFENYNESKLLTGKAAAFEKAVSARADNLRVLADLYKSGYFAINSTKDTPTTSEATYRMKRERLTAGRPEPYTKMSINPFKE